MLGRVVGEPILAYTIGLLLLLPFVEPRHHGDLRVPIADSGDDLCPIHVSRWCHFLGGRLNLCGARIGGTVNF